MKKKPHYLNITNLNSLHLEDYATEVPSSKTTTIPKLQILNLYME